MMSPVVKSSLTGGSTKLLEIVEALESSESSTSSKGSKIPNPLAFVADLFKEKYPVHKDISTTFFWVGEPSDEDNHFIPNKASAWDDEWMKHYGGPDDPEKRKNLLPENFKPKENPFYFALPYNDFDEDGKRRKDLSKVVYWFDQKKWGKEESMLKNRWIKITKGDKDAYAQWEDVGPFGEDDAKYVFGKSAPKNKDNKSAGLDVSPAVKEYLGLKDLDKTDWQFVDEKDVPDGPWKEVITKSQVNWK